MESRVGIAGRTQSERTTEARSRILEAAFSCFAAQGYHGTTLTDIAVRAGISRELPRYHFGSREGMVSALLDAVTTYWRDLFHSKCGELVSLAVALATMGQMLHERLPLLRGQASILFGAADPGSRVVREKALAAQNVIHSSLLQIVRKEIEAGGVRALPQDKATIRVAIIFATFRGLLYQSVLDEQSGQLKATWDEFTRMLTTR